MDPQTKDEAIRIGQRAKDSLEVLLPYFRVVEASYTEQLVAIKGWRAWWRGDRRRAEAAARIQAVRDVLAVTERVISAGRIAATPPRKVGL